VKEFKIVEFVGSIAEIKNPLNLIEEVAEKIVKLNSVPF